MRAFLACLLLAGAAVADLVTMKDGRVLEGDVLSDDGTTVRLRMRLGTINIRKDEIVSIEEKATPEEEYEERLRGLDRQDAKALLELGEWLLTKKMTRQAIDHLIEADRLDPAAEGPRAALGRIGWHKAGDEWQDENTRYLGRGWTRWEGRWIHPVEYSWRLSQQVLKLLNTRVEATRVRRGNAAAAKRRQEETVGRLTDLVDRGPRLLSSADAEIDRRAAEERAAGRDLERARREEDSTRRTLERERDAAARGLPNNAAGAEVAHRRAQDAVSRRVIDAAAAERNADAARRAAREVREALDRAETDLAVARGALDQAAADLKTAQAALDELEAQLPAAIADEARSHKAWQETRAAGMDK